MTSPVKNIDALSQLIRENGTQLNTLGVSRLGVFGSFVRDEVTPSSDIDFLVEFKSGEKSFDHFIELAFFLETITGRKVELVTPQSLSRYIGPHILSEVSYVSFAA